MRLPEFILHSMEDILREWESFAATLLPAAEGMSSLALRDHAEQILEAVAKDIDSPQSRREEVEKSKGWAPVDPEAPETAAQTHAVLRAHSGFDIKQLVAEYRALRASVLRLWLDANPLEPGGVPDVIRFSEAIDQAIAESVSHFDAQQQQSRNLLLGVLGHDMRNPLNNMLMTAQFLQSLNAGEQVSVAASRLMRSGASLQALLNDLVDFNRMNLGLGLSIASKETDLADALKDEVEQLQGAYPERDIVLTMQGELRGRWDAQRVQQVLRNLVVNGVVHGDPDSVVRVNVEGGADSVLLEVTNRGPHLHVGSVDELFEPLKRGEPQEDGGQPGGMGLGLFIVREVVRSHGGDVAVRSVDGDVTFSVRLPR